jgi:hypothetical protein
MTDHTPKAITNLLHSAIPNAVDAQPDTDPFTTVLSITDRILDISDPDFSAGL